MLQKGTVLAMNASIYETYNLYFNGKVPHYYMLQSLISYTGSNLEDGSYDTVPRSSLIGHKVSYDSSFLAWSSETSLSKLYCKD